MILNQHQFIGIVALSNGLSESQRPVMKELELTLNQLGLQVRWPSKLFRIHQVYHATDQEKAQMLMEFYQDEQVQAIFDVSGGDLANGVLSYLDYEMIKRHPKPFFGYSDLTVVLNALHKKTSHPTYLYQIRHLVGPLAQYQQKLFYQTFFHNQKDLFTWDVKWIQGESMQGEVVGGNIRCFLKLAGTEYMPSFKGKLLLLESYSGDVAKMATYLNQYKQLHIFEEINGLILGHFTEMQQKEYEPDIINLVRMIVDNDQLPIVKTEDIGHGANSKAAIIGETLTLVR